MGILDAMRRWEQDEQKWFQDAVQIVDTAFRAWESRWVRGSELRCEDEILIGGWAYEVEEIRDLGGNSREITLRDSTGVPLQIYFTVGGSDDIEYERAKGGK